MEARQRLERALEQASAATTEARHAVQGLRASSIETTDPASLWNIVAELTREHDSATCDSRRGTGHASTIEAGRGRRGLSHHGEALRNALHTPRNTSPPRFATTSGGSDPRARRWQGFDEQAVRRDPPAGHFGLNGMRERAEKIGGSLEVWSKPASGRRSS